MRKNKVLLTHVFIIFIFSLVPFLWIKQGEMIAGHDAGFPLSPWNHFLDRVFVWTHRFGLGNDQTTEVGGFFIHGFEGLVSYLGFNLTQVQQITFSTYIFGFGISMYILARSLFPERRKYLPLFAAILYMFNHFILQAWFIAERTKFTLYIALPLVLACIIKLYKREINPVTAASLSAITIFFLNGGGFLPLYGGFLISIPFVLILLNLLDRRRFFNTVVIFSLYTVVWVALTLLVNAFWIVPYIRFALTSFAAEVTSAGGQSGVVAWVQSISEHSSFYNLFRLQGIQEWYVNPLHPYASTFLNNPIFYIFSHILPFFAFGSLLLATKKEKKVVALFCGLALVSMLFTAGSHPPFGAFYIWMITHVPGFIAFRTPFYKFAPALWLSYAVLIAFSIDVLLSQKLKFKRLAPFSAALIVICLCVYNFPFFKGNFFDYEVGKKTTKIVVPQYVLDYAKWANSDEFPYRRLLLLPGQNPNTRFEAYTWKYWSLAQVQGLLDNQSYIGNSLYKTTTEEIFIQHLYNLIAKNDPSWVDEAQYLFVDAVLLRKDFDYTLANSETTNPLQIKAFLEKDSRFKKVKEFGEWEIYELKNHSPAFSLKNYYYQVSAQNKERFFEPTTLPNMAVTTDTVFLEQDAQEIRDKRKGVIYIPDCNHCLLGNRTLYPIDRNQLVTGGSVFYPSKIDKDKKKLSAIKNPQNKLDYASQMTTTRIYELTSQFSRNAATIDRIEGWKALSETVELEKKALDEYLSSIEKYGIGENTFFSTFYENVEQQIEELQVGLEKVNQKEEAALFEKSLQGLQQIRALIEKDLWYSKDNLFKKYLVYANEPGEYEIFLKTNTANIFNQENTSQLKGSFSFFNNNIPVSVNATNKQNNLFWTRIGTTNLTEGLNRLQLSDTDSKKYLNTTGSLDFTISTEHKCEEQPLGHLEKNTYKFNFEATTLKDQDDFYVFIDLAGNNRVPLPFWGRRLILEGQKKVFLDFNHEVIDSGDYVIRFCRLNTGEIESQEVTLTNTYFERISDPLIVLLKSEQPAATVSSTLSVTSQEINQTAYQLNITGKGSALLMFDQRFDPGWIFDQSNYFSSHHRVHGYANGWIINKTDETTQEIKLNYIGQKLYRTGWIISIGSVCAIVVYLLSRLLKKKELI